MKKEIFNILFLSAIVLVVAWLYWPKNDEQIYNKTSNNKNYILALSWQPAFCESKPNKPECRSQHGRRFDARNFSLHGLWPQPRNNVYCNVSQSFIKKDKRGRWNELPRLDIRSDIRKELAVGMPGYRSNLHRHEWYKHGTCMDVNAEQYYQLSIDLLNKINETQLSALFAQNIGKQITAAQVTKAMHVSFGKGAGQRIKMNCKKDGRRTLITGLHISIGYEIQLGEALTNNNYILNAPKLSSGCKRGVVDPVGLQ